MAVDDCAKVIVTGGAGYIGSHVCKQLSQSGYIPVAVDDLSQGHAYAVRWGPLERGHIGDAAFLDNLFQAYRPSAVLHFAAHAYVGESVREPLRYYRNNVADTIILLERMIIAGIRSFVFSSSCATYGVPPRIPIREEDEQRPINPYGMTKLIIERLLQELAPASDLRHVILRYFNAAGADLDTQAGEDHDPETHVIPLAIQAALGERRYFELFGDDYDTPDGTCIRDFVHVTDLAEAHVLALRHLETGGENLALNLGSSVGASVREVLDVVIRHTNAPIKVITQPRRSGDPPILVADPSRAKSILGWVPKYSDLDTLISTALRWHIRRC